MNTNFTKIVLLGFAIFLGQFRANAQTGLQNVIVEKYYVSDANDSAASMGVLPVGSVTYRIFLDMKQGYRFQSAFGVPLHTLFINSTTSFFNNEDRGSTSPTYTKTQAKSNTVMLDSWLSAGAGCMGNIGVLKSADDGIGTVVNSDHVLQNEDPLAGIPLSLQDGLLAGTPGSVITLGIDAALSVFDATSQAGNSFNVQDGVWSCLAGAVGPDTTNKVLIAQITTDGVLSFELNIQLGTPDGGTEQFVAKNPTGLETQLACLTYNSLYAGTVKPVAKNNTDKVIVFPNPTTGKFSLTINSENYNHQSHYAIYNLIGEVICRRNIENAQAVYTENIDLGAYPKGIYFMEVTTGANKTTRKIIKN